MNRSIKTFNSPPRGRRAFTLLEVIVGIGLIGLVMTGIYSVAAASLKLANDVTFRQQHEMHLHSFLSVMRRNIEDIPGNARISMEPPAGAGGVLRSEIVLEDYPLAFSWARVAAGSKRVLVISDKDPRGGTQVRIRYLDADEAQVHSEQGSIPDDGGRGIVLIDGLKSVRWRFFNPRTRSNDPEESWEEDWVRPNERPSLVEMTIEFFDESEPLRSVFWIPVVANPEAVVRGVQNGNRNQGVVRPGGGGVQPPDGATGTVVPDRAGGRVDGRSPRRVQGAAPRTGAPRVGGPLPSIPNGNR